VFLFAALPCDIAAKQVSVFLTPSILESVGSKFSLSGWTLINTLSI
jgi:hypothetical protein